VKTEALVFNTKQCLLVSCAVTAAWLPSDAWAQTVATSFAELQPLVKVGEQVVVTDANGLRTKGRISDLSPSTLVILTPQQKSFSESGVTAIRRTDSVWNGALIGLGAGGALALAGFAATGDSDAWYGWAYVGSWLVPSAGMALGWAVDAGTVPAPVYLSAPGVSKVTVSVSPVAATKGLIASVSIRY
jgi:hypothetical protein